MNNEYFRTKEFYISDHGIHMLRSGFDYQTIKFSEIREAKIEKGMELHNWFVIYLIGAVLLIGGIYFSTLVLDQVIYGDDSGTRSAKLMVVIFIPLIGFYFLYNSLERGLLLKLYFKNGKRTKFPLRRLNRSNQVDELKAFLIAKM